MTATLRGLTFPPGQTATVPPGSSTATFLCTNSNNAIALQLTLTYDVRDSTTGEVVARDQALAGRCRIPAVRRLPNAVRLICGSTSASADVGKGLIVI